MKLGISEKKIASTKLNLGEIFLEAETMEKLKAIEAKILSEGLSREVINLLKEVYFKMGTFEKIGVNVVGGQRKVEALKTFAEEKGIETSSISAIGDSITDYKMLDEVRKQRGLAIAFNANQYCLPYADVAIASVDGRALIPVLEEFISKGKEAAIGLVSKFESDEEVSKEGFEFLNLLTPKPHYTNITSVQDFDEVLKIHKKIRMLVRGEAGKLG
jgi:energy-converting hydrogenase A subunit R